MEFNWPALVKAGIFRTSSQEKCVQSQQLVEFGFCLQASICTRVAGSGQTTTQMAQ
jgi:hypothetical protein